MEAPVLFRACSLSALMVTTALFGAQAQPPLEGSNRSIQVQQGNAARLRLALVVGNDGYHHLGHLRNAREDARAVAISLKQLGFQVTLLTDATEKSMKEALRTFKGQIRGGDMALFYFSGHGVQLGGTNYLLPTDVGGESEEQVKDDSIPLQRVLDDLEEQKASFSLAIIDACRDNPFKQSGRAIGGRGLAPTSAATGQMVLFSAGAGQQALDSLGNSDTSGHGVFTRVLLQEMVRPGVPVDRLLRHVREEVVKLARSVGHEQVPALYDQALGEFYFVPGTGVAHSATVPPSQSSPDGVVGSLHSFGDNAAPPQPPPMNGNLQVAVNAPDASVWLNGELKGKASPTQACNIPNVLAGAYRLRVTAEGYNAFEQSIDIEEGRWNLAKAFLKRHPDSKIILLPHEEALAAGDTL